MLGFRGTNIMLIVNDIHILSVSIFEGVAVPLPPPSHRSYTTVMLLKILEG